MMYTKNYKRKKAFTLVELMLGMTIMSLAMVSAYTMLDASITAYRQGIKSMEVYQAARIGLRRAADELRFSLSGNAFWQPSTPIQILSQEQAMINMTGPVIQETDPGKVIFKGFEDRVVFTRKVYRLGQNPPFDLQECMIHVNPDTQQLMLTVLRSLLMVKQLSWWYQIEFQTNLAGFTFAEAGNTDVRYRMVGNSPDAPPLDVYIGNYGTINQTYLLAEHIQSVKFRYADSGNYVNDWNSTDIVRTYAVSTQSRNFNAIQDTIVREKGPPQVIEIALELTNGEIMMTATDVPAGNMTNLGGRGNPQGGASPQTVVNSPSNAPGTYNETQFNIPATLPGF